jgi:UDP-glucose 4-epimerase
VKILITGSNGFVGGGVGRWAARAGHEVLGVARASQPAAGWPGQYAQADVLTSDLVDVVRAFAPDVVLHGAGTASVAASLQTPLDDLRAAVLTWANTLDAVRRSHLRPLVLFPSSAAVYGNPVSLPVGEEARARPISPYGFHKVACELLAREYAECFRLRVVVCRLFSLFGAAQRRLLLWELYRQAATASDTIWLEGTGAETRDYLHIDDIAAALVALASAAETQDARGGRLLVVNVASGEEISVLELARLVRDLVAPTREVRCRGIERAGDPRVWRADITRLRALAPQWQPRPLAGAVAVCIAEWKKESGRK